MALYSATISVYSLKHSMFPANICSNLHRNDDKMKCIQIRTIYGQSVQANKNKRHTNLLHFGKAEETDPDANCFYDRTIVLQCADTIIKQWPLSVILLLRHWQFTWRLWHELHSVSIKHTLSLFPNTTNAKIWMVICILNLIIGWGWV